MQRQFYFDEISVRSIAVDIIKNIWLFILVAVAAWFAVTGAEKLLYVPEYTASTTLAVTTTGNTSNTYSSLSLTKQMASIVSEVFSSNVLKEKVAEDLEMDAVEGDITTTVIEETNLITLSVTADNPRKAYLIISSVLDNYDSVSDYLISNAALRIVKEPSVPFAPSNYLNMNRMKAMAMLGSCIICLILICFFSIFRFTVKTKSSAERNLDGKILGYIPYEHQVFNRTHGKNQKKRSLMISNNWISFRFVESYRRITTRIHHYMRRKNMKVVMVVSVLENEGKSSASVNFALALAEKGKKVLLLDGDLKKPAQYRIFDRPETGKKWLSEYFDGQASFDDLLYEDKDRKLFTIFQNVGLRDSGVLLSSEKMKQLLQEARERMDYVVIDSPPMDLSSDVDIMAQLADLVLMVVRQDVTDIRIINDAVDEIRKSKAEFGGFIINGFHQDILIPRIENYGKYYENAKNKSVAKE